jgi:hypothetical protein
MKSSTLVFGLAASLVVALSFPILIYTLPSRMINSDFFADIASFFIILGFVSFEILTICCFLQYKKNNKHGTIARVLVAVHLFFVVIPFSPIKQLRFFDFYTLIPLLFIMVTILGVSILVKSKKLLIIFIIFFFLIIFFIPKESGYGGSACGSSIMNCECFGFRNDQWWAGGFNDECYGIPYSCFYSTFCH